MVFLFESIFACVIFTLLIKLIAHNRQEVFTNDYPPIVTDKLRALGLIAEKPPAKKKDIIRKLIAMIVFALLFALLLRYVNGIETFWEGAVTAYGLWFVVDWYGCRVLLEVLADERLTITTAIADGMSTHDYPNIKSKLGKEIYLFFFTGFFYQMMGKAGPMRKKLLAKLTGRKPEEAERLLYPDATWQSWKKQDTCLINRPMNFEVFKNTDMHIWHGINSQVERKLAKDIHKWQDAGYAFTYKVFRNVGHGGLIAEHTEQFIEEVKAVHAARLSLCAAQA